MLETVSFLFGRALRCCFEDLDVFLLLYLMACRSNLLSLDGSLLSYRLEP